MAGHKVVFREGTCKQPLNINHPHPLATTDHPNYLIYTAKYYHGLASLTEPPPPQLESLPKNPQISIIYVQRF